MRNPRLRQLAIITVGTLVYALLGWWSLHLALTQANSSAVWPLAGLGIGLLARFGFRLWPIVCAGAFITNLLINLQHGVAMPPAITAAVGISLGNTAEALCGAWLARRALGNPPEFWSVEGVFRFVFFAGLIPPILSAGGGALSLRFAGILPEPQVGNTAFTWFTGNVAGILTCAPLFFIDSFRLTWRKGSDPSVVEWVLVLVLLVFVAQTISGIYFAQELQNWPKSYMVIPLFLWIACRLGRRGTVLAVLMLMAISVAGTMRGFAAFPAKSHEQSLLALQLFISVVAVIGLTVSVLMHQLRRQREALENALADKAIRLIEVKRENAILTASAVHDLQSPLSGMRNLLQLVRGRPEIFAGPDGGGLLAEMHATVERMFGLVTGALAISHPESEGGLTRESTPNDITDLVKRVVEAEQAHADSKRIQIHTSIPRQPFVLVTHDSVLEHIVGNFLSNAVKFSQPGASISLDLEQTDGVVSISVTDQGPGIPESDRAAIFSGEIRSNRARPTGGESSSGMGLYLVGELAIRLGAKVTCEPTQAGGSVFSVCIPVPDGGPD